MGLLFSKIFSKLFGHKEVRVLILGLDSVDRDRMQIARQELMAMLEEEELKDTILLVFANKQDMDGAMSEAEVSEGLGLTTIKNRQWHICKSAAIKNEGLTEGLDWMADAIMGTAPPQPTK